MLDGFVDRGRGWYRERDGEGAYRSGRWVVMSRERSRKRPPVSEDAVSALQIEPMLMEDRTPTLRNHLEIFLLGRAGDVSSPVEIVALPDVKVAELLCIEMLDVVK